MVRRFSVVALLICLGVSLFAIDVQKDIVDKARAYVGAAYVTGGTRPPEFDCSGFVGFILRPFVPGLPRLSRDMAASGTPVAKGSLRPGDLVFFATTPDPLAISHVALYIGDGSIIHAISDGPERGVHVTPLDARYWKKHFASAVRVLGSADEKSAGTAAGTGSVAGTGSAKKESGTTANKPKVVTVPEAKGSVAASPWDTWDGYVMGDYAQWKAEEKKKLDAQEKAFDKDAEARKFEDWKKTHGE
jgi:hypothetical protein